MRTTHESRPIGLPLTPGRNHRRPLCGTGRDRFLQIIQSEAPFVPRSEPCRESAGTLPRTEPNSPQITASLVTASLAVQALFPLGVATGILRKNAGHACGKRPPVGRSPHFKKIKPEVTPC